jgi:predicted HAD superfamily phosphohydrolase YqeG
MIGERDLKKVWIVGDRLMTDIYLANQIGCSSLLVDPLEPSTISKHGLAVYLLRKA